MSVVDGNATASCLRITNVPGSSRVEGFVFTAGTTWVGGGLYLEELIAHHQRHRGGRATVPFPAWLYAGGYCSGFSTCSIHSMILRKAGSPSNMILPVGP